MNHRREGQAGYLGPAAEAQRSRELIAARLASPKRGRAAADDPATLALFGEAMEPKLF